jgi:hypothetical protein
VLKISGMPNISLERTLGGPRSSPPFGIVNLILVSNIEYGRVKATVEDTHESGCIHRIRTSGSP